MSFMTAPPFSPLSFDYPPSNVSPLFRCRFRRQRIEAVLHMFCFFAEDFSPRKSDNVFGGAPVVFA
ncbi:hypothetical protein MTR_6g059715 [Medicago truncatula]|uniref:Uncharacterized protein n=1 Tax=Medicago truncatula TaxID=3880 RepID=A0A072U9Y4_MEDTR|nr:hypothetical protein MTR_6g059715 [Medicago truncatula]